MESALSNRLSYLPYKNLEKVSDLIEFEGPVLTHYKDDRGNDVLFYWVDFDENYNRWLVWKASKVQLYKYLSNKLALRDLIISEDNDFIFAVDIDKEFNFSHIYQVLTSELHSAYLPNSQSFYYGVISEPYKQFIDEVELSDYLLKMRERAIYFKMSPNSLKYLTTIGALEASNFLRNLSQSYISFAVHDFIINFRDSFISIEALKNAIHKVKDQINPRVVDLNFSSFKVAIGSDAQHEQTYTSLSSVSESAKYVMWRRNIMQKYNDAVVNVDYNSPEKVDIIIQQYPEEVRSEIFRPFIDIINNKSYKVEVSTLERKESTSLEKIPRSTKRLIITKTKKLSEPDASSRELMNLVVSIPKGKRLSEINLNSLIQNTLFSYTDQQITIKYPNALEDDKYYIEVDGNKIKLNEPLTCQIVALESGSAIICPQLDIRVEANNINDLYEKFNRSILDFYMQNYLNSNKDEKSSIYKVKYFSSIFDSIMQYK